MSYVYHSPEYFRTKLYQKEREFKKFETLTLDDVAKVAKKLYSKQEMNAQSEFFRKDKLIYGYFNLFNKSIHSYGIKNIRRKNNLSNNECRSRTRII